MITTSIERNGRFTEICTEDCENNSCKDLAEAGREALAIEWGQGEDGDELLASLGGGIELTTISESSDELIASARSADGRFSEKIMVSR